MVGCAFQLENKSIARADEEVEQEEGEEEEESSEIELGKRIEKLRWVELLLIGEFFGSCEEHREDRKSEENIFCVDCGSRMCSHCLAGNHRDHRLLQIRRYVYQDVVRIHDMANLLDCSKVQVSDMDSPSPVLTVKEPTVCCQSEPLLADRAASSEEQPSPSPAASPPPFDEGQEDAGRSIPEPSVRRVHRRKGFPRRAPF